MPENQHLILQAMVRFYITFLCHLFRKCKNKLSYVRLAALLEHLQGRLGSLVGKSSGYLETLPQQVQTRIKGLKHLHVRKSLEFNFM